MSSSSVTGRPVALVLLVVSVLLGACAAGPPDAEELAAGMTTGNSLFPIAEQFSECAADHLLASDLDDDVLRAIADSDAEYELDAPEASRLASLQVEVLTTCPGKVGS